MDWQKTPLNRDDVADQIARIPKFLGPIARVAGNIAETGAWLEKDSGAFLAGYRPDIGSHAYDIVIYPPQTRSLLDTYQQINGFPLPETVIEMLSYVNGCTILGLSIYGAPTSMAKNPPMLNRSLRVPLDISSGRHWRIGYVNPHKNEVLFASKNVGDDGQIGYFVNPIGLVVGRGNDSSEVDKHSGSWDNITDWLASELGQVR
jgi:hypothetical protein